MILVKLVSRERTSGRKSEQRENTSTQDWRCRVTADCWGEIAQRLSPLRMRPPGRRCLPARWRKSPLYQKERRKKKKKKKKKRFLPLLERRKKKIEGNGWSRTGNLALAAVALLFSPLLLLLLLLLEKNNNKNWLLQTHTRQYNIYKKKKTRINYTIKPPSPIYTVCLFKTFFQGAQRERDSANKAHTDSAQSQLSCGADSEDQLSVGRAHTNGN